MLVYSLDRKQTTKCTELYTDLIRIAKKECVLIIDEKYCIERFVTNDFLFYVHIKENGRTIDKICVYKRKDRID